jgi:dTDP-4-dehydrorhamnose reductase
LKILITGASGLYGSRLAELSTKNKHEIHSGYSKDLPAFGTRVQFDISDKKQVESTFNKVNPEVVVHAATMTDVDKCELNKELAWKTNVEGTKNVVEATKAKKAFLLYISTDYVFNGEKGQYNETDMTDPINYYGLTKLKAEELVKNATEEWCIARPSVMYGASPATGKINFALWIINKLQKGEQAKIVTDQWISPTLNTSLADMTLEVIERRLAGIYHLSGETRMNRFDFAKQIAQTFNLDAEMIIPVTSAEIPWVAKRPRDSSLDTSKAQKTLRSKPLEIHQALHRLKQELATIN